MKKQWFGMAVWLAMVWAAGAQVQAVSLGDSEVVLERREPTLRKVNAERDAAVMERIEFFRDKLPEPFKARRNFAWALAEVEGLEKKEYFAHSGIQGLDVFSSETAEAIRDISVKPAAGHFHVLCVNQRNVVDGPDCWVREVDTEYKILEEMVAHLPDTKVKGRVKLYTDLPPCASCWNVILQFMAEYPNIQMQVLYKQK